MEKELTRYNELKQQIFDIVKFCAIQKIMSSEHKQMPTHDKSKRAWREKVVFPLMGGLVQDFKDESNKLFGKEYDINGIWSCAIKKAYDYVGKNNNI